MQRDMIGLAAPTRIAARPRWHDEHAPCSQRPAYESWCFLARQSSLQIGLDSFSCIQRILSLAIDVAVAPK